MKKQESNMFNSGGGRYCERIKGSLPAFNERKDCRVCQPKTTPSSEEKRGIRPCLIKEKTREQGSGGGKTSAQFSVLNNREHGTENNGEVLKETSRPRLGNPQKSGDHSGIKVEGGGGRKMHHFKGFAPECLRNCFCRE